jgi:hypothetical protein
MRALHSRRHIVLLTPLFLVCSSSTFAHDSWIARGGFRAPAGNEWCCGEHDCFVVPSDKVKRNGVGYELLQPVETVPYRETLQSVDGQYWRCQRPDGSRRCFFAPPPGV